MSGNEWQDVFCGREEELKFLKNKWKLVSDPKNPKPQVAVLLAESGMGKTRLVQEFYGWLSENEDHDHYWPKKLALTGENLRVNPEVNEFSDECIKMPYLWWGIRFSDPKGHNNQVVSHLSGYLDFLALHLQPLYQARFDLHRKTEAMKLLMGAFTLNVYDHIQSVIDTTHMLTDAIKQWRKGKKSDQNAAPKHKRSESVFTDIKDVLQQPNQSTLEKLGITHADIINVPLVLWLDDAQWADKEVLSLLKALLKEANTNNWPLMIIVTHWEREWAENKGKSKESFVRTLTEVMDDASIEAMIQCLHGNQKLEGLLKAALPGLTEEQSLMFLDKGDGNPRALNELIQFARDNRAHFIGRDIKLALNESAFERLRTKELSFDAAMNKRFASLPDDVKDFISLGSIQGTVFLDDISRAVLKNLWEVDCTNDVAIKSESPYAVTKKQSFLSSEFRGRAFYLRAYETMKLSDEDYVKAKRLTLQEIEQMTVDGRLMQLTVEEQQRLRSLYKDMVVPNYKPLYPEAKRTIESEYIKDQNEMIYEDISEINYQDDYDSCQREEEYERSQREDEYYTPTEQYEMDMDDDKLEMHDALICPEEDAAPNISALADADDEYLEELLGEARVKAEERRFSEQEAYYPGNDRIYIPSHAIEIILEHARRVELVNFERDMIDEFTEQQIGEWELSGDYGVLCSDSAFSSYTLYSEILRYTEVPFLYVHDFEIGIGMPKLMNWEAYCPPNKVMGIKGFEKKSETDGLTDAQIRERYPFPSNEIDNEILCSIEHGIDFALWNKIIDWDAVKTKLAQMPKEEPSALYDVDDKWGSGDFVDGGDSTDTSTDGIPF